MAAPPLHLVLGGVRGSTPVAASVQTVFGGATCSLLVDGGDGARVVIDAGTGLLNLAAELATPAAGADVLVLFTHYHLDHLIGLPPFPPLYDPAWRVTFAAPEREGVTPAHALSRLTAAPFWPAPFRARQRFVTLPDTCADGPFRHGPFEVRWCAVRHTNGCHAYRIDRPDAGASLVLATDIEWQDSTPAERDALLRLCREPHPADLLLMEGYGEAAGATGRGHCRWQDAVEVARLAGVRRLLLTHLAPGDTDADLLARERLVRAHWPGARIGRQGMRLACPGSPP